RHQRIGFDQRDIAAACASGEPSQIADLREEARSEVNEIVLRAGYRARLLAPLMRGEEIVGLLVVRRKTPGSFANNIMHLRKTFGRSRCWRSRTRGCSMRSTKKVANLRSRAAINRSS